jgi:pimeloyl-ACP methyl ester carboxylesterase
MIARAWAGASQVPNPAAHSKPWTTCMPCLAASGERGPFVLVEHSNGGLRAALYAHTYPQEVSGVMLVDPTPRATDEE